jgi:TolB-like protein/DNA-binding winged helix-turn-helix (wHTH) protein/Tfp pilus assembly protein PilF
MPPQGIQFGAFELDSAAGELRKHGIKIRLQEQPLQILQQLLEHPGEVVTREDLQKHIWPADTFVDFDHGLYSAVQRLRDALGDNAETPRYVETLPRRGYRFIAAVHHGNGVEAKLEATSVEAPASGLLKRPAPRRSLRITLLVAAGIAVVVLLSALEFMGGSLRERLLGKVRAPPIRSLAVLPLQNLSNDPNQEYFADGMTDALITDLAQIASLKVISRTSTMRYKKSEKKLPEIARELNVDGIIEGTVQRSGDRVRITAQLIHGPSDEHLWANSYERDASDVFALERDVTVEIARQVQAQLTTRNVLPLQPPPQVNLKALEAYLQGEYHLDRYGKGYNGEELRRAVEYFQQATTEDPSFAPAYVKICETYEWEGDLSRPSEVMPREKAAAARALSINPNLSDAHLALARVELEYDWDWADAEKEFRKSLELNPNNASAHEAFGDYLEVMGHMKEGLDEQLRAQELDPHGDHLSNGFYRSRQFDRGIEWLRKQIEIDPDKGVHHAQLISFYAQKGTHGEYVEETLREMTLYGFPQLAESLRHNYASSGYAKSLRELAAKVEELQNRGSVTVPGFLAEMYMDMGDKEKALRWLEEAYKERDAHMVFLNTDPEWDSVRSDQRFLDLVRRVGLTP